MCCKMLRRVRRGCIFRRLRVLFFLLLHSSTSSNGVFLLMLKFPDLGEDKVPALELDILACSKGHAASVVGLDRQLLGGIAVGETPVNLCDGQEFDGSNGGNLDVPLCVGVQWSRVAGRRLERRRDVRVIGHNHRRLGLLADAD